MAKTTKKPSEAQKLVTVKVTPWTLQLARFVAALNDEKLYTTIERAVARELLRVSPELRKALRVQLPGGQPRKGDK
jgi:hypothetical protein